MVYGLNDTTPERIARWREAGYRVHLMTGISWGTYQDYLDGRWDGSDHWADAQTAGDGSPILHGKSTDIPYMVPTFSFTEYLVQKLRPIIELGVEGIHLEEPEFWARAGYSESFKREWQAFFDEPWQPPHSTPEAHFRAGQLKQHLLSRSLDRVTSVLRDEALQQGRAGALLRPDAQPPELHPVADHQPRITPADPALDRRRDRAGVDRNRPGRRTCTPGRSPSVRSRRRTWSTASRRT